MELFLDGKVTLYPGDCRELLKLLPDNSVDSAVMDPPYALVSIVKRFGGDNAAPAKHGKDGAYSRASAGFMGKTWDTGETAFAVEFWAEVYRVLKPGAHLAAFSGTRTYHRMAVAIDDSGFEIRDMLSWNFGTGFPKSHSMRDIGRPELGTALKPAHEPICLARKPLSEKTVAANVLKWGTGAINVDGCRVGDEGGSITVKGELQNKTVHAFGDGLGAQGGTIERPYGLGRFPANLIHDGSDEVVGAFPNSDGATSNGRKGENGVGNWGHGAQTQVPGYADSGSAARFFYSAKADADDRLGSKHPTVKPVDLMQWLCRLITPPGGAVLDCFAGTGTTGEAAWREGFSAIIMEREAEYQEDIRRRMKYASQHSSARKLTHKITNTETSIFDVE